MLSMEGGISYNEDNLWDLIDSFEDEVPKENLKTKERKCLNCSSINIVQDQSKGCMKCTDCGACTQQLFDDMKMEKVKDQ